MHLKAWIYYFANLDTNYKMDSQIFILGARMIKKYDHARVFDLDVTLPDLRSDFFLSGTLSL